MKKPAPPSSQWERDLRKLGLVSVILGELIACTGAGIGLGYLAWSKWGAPKLIFLPTSLLGLFLGFYQIYRTSKNDLD